MSRRMGVLQLLAHVLVVVLLTLRSVQLSRAINPFERSLADEWTHLLYYVEDSDGSFLPRFLLDVDEQVAASVEDEFISGGAVEKTSALPVGVLFTINETISHLHGALDNYYQLDQVALEPYHTASPSSSIDPPKLIVRKINDTKRVDEQYILSPHNESAWPEPLQLSHISPSTRSFFDELVAMKLEFVVGMENCPADLVAVPTQHIDGIDLLLWKIMFVYDFKSQSHLQLTMSYKYHFEQVEETTISMKQNEEMAMPTPFVDQTSHLDWILLLVIFLYQAAETGIKYTQESSVHDNPPGWQHIRMVLTLQTDIPWFWITTFLNLTTIGCLIAAWSHTFKLAERAGLNFIFATCTALQWVTLGRHMKSNTRLHILGRTLRRGLPRVLRFLLGVLPLFVGFVLFGTIMFGASVPRFQSLSATATTLFAIANGDEIRETFESVSYTPWIGQLYVYSYLILFSYVVLMVCIGIIEDAFFSAVFPSTWPSLDGAHTQRQTRPMAGRTSSMNTE